MIEEQAEVIAVYPAGIRVRVDRKSACGHCHVATTCGHGALERFMLRRSSTVEFDLPGQVGYAFGDRLIIGIADSILIKSAAIGYLVPLLGLFLGLLLGYGLGHLANITSEWPQIAGLAVGLAAGFYVSSLLAEHRRKRIDFLPVILRRIDDVFIGS